MHGPGKQIGYRKGFDDLAGLHHRRAIRDPRDCAKVVGNQQKTHGASPRQPA